MRQKPRKTTLWLFDLADKVGLHSDEDIKLANKIIDDGSLEKVQEERLRACGVTMEILKDLEQTDPDLARGLYQEAFKVFGDPSHSQTD